MQIQNSSRRRTILFVLFCILGFGLAAHAYRYFSIAMSHDSVMIFQDETRHQITLGRFLQPLYLQLRGKLCVPFLIGMFSLLWLSIAAYLMIQLLEYKTKLAIFLACGILVTNSSLSLLNASYLPWSDIFMMALLLSVFSVYLARKQKYGFLYGSVFLCLSLALYQSYLEVAVSISILLLIKDAFDNLSVKSLIIRGLQAVCMLFLGLVFYYFSSRIVCHRLGYELSNSYNGIASISNFTDVSILRLIIDSYVFPASYLLAPETFHPTVTSVATILLILLTAFFTVLTCHRNKLKPMSVLLVILLIAVLPFGMNVVFFFSKGMKHALMTFSFNLIYIFVLLTWEYFFIGNEPLPPFDLVKHRFSFLFIGKAFLLCSFCVILLNNIVYANQLYYKKELESQATLSVMTRVIDKIEETEGYVCGQTPVVFLGVLSDSQISVDRPGFENMDAIGMDTNYSLTYGTTIQSYINNVLGYPMNIVTDDVNLEDERTSLMPSYPDLGYIQLIDGVMYVKFS